MPYLIGNLHELEIRYIVLDQHAMRFDFAFGNRHAVKVDAEAIGRKPGILPVTDFRSLHPQIVKKRAARLVHGFTHEAGIDRLIEIISKAKCERIVLLQVRVALDALSW